MAGLTSREKQAVENLVKRLRRRLGRRLAEIRFYGSKARKAGGRHSDIDLLVLVRRHTVRVREDVFTEVSAVMLEYEVMLDVHLMSLTEMRELARLGTLYAKTVQEEGILL
jgi:predicted nucleotidyltransferase